MWFFDTSWKRKPSKMFLSRNCSALVAYAISLFVFAVFFSLLLFTVVDVVVGETSYFFLQSFLFPKIKTPPNRQIANWWQNPRSSSIMQIFFLSFLSTSLIFHRNEIKKRLCTQVVQACAWNILPSISCDNATWSRIWNVRDASLLIARKLYCHSNRSYVHSTRDRAQVWGFLLCEGGGRC